MQCYYIIIIINIIMTHCVILLRCDGISQCSSRHDFPFPLAPDGRRAGEAHPRPSGRPSRSPCEGIAPADMGHMHIRVSRPITVYVHMFLMCIDMGTWICANLYI